MIHNVDFCFIYTTLRKTYYKTTLLLSVWDCPVVLGATSSEHYTNIKFIFTTLLWVDGIDFILLVETKAQWLESDEFTNFYVPNLISCETKFFSIFDTKLSLTSSETKFPLASFPARSVYIFQTKTCRFQLKYPGDKGEIISRQFWQLWFKWFA